MNPVKKILAFILTTIAYYSTGEFGLLLAIPPGFSSAVWPASGVALTCLILLPRTAAAAGVCVGSFLVNFGLTSSAYMDISLENAIPALSIATGAMLQAVFAFWLFQTFIGNRTVIEEQKEVLGFALMVAPIGSVIAPIVGVGTLYTFNLIAASNCAFTGFTWWTGDTIGVLLFTPLLLTIFSREKQLPLLRRLQIVLPTLLIFIVILLLFFASTNVRHKAISTEIEDNSHRFIRNIEERLLLAEHKLKSLTAFYNGSDNVTREEFNRFAKTLLEEDTIFHGVGWTEIVPASQRESYEREIQNSGFPTFTFTELAQNGSIRSAQQRAEYYPVLYIYPFKKNSRAFGLDLGANPDRLNTLIHARQFATPVSTPPIILAQEAENERALIVYCPVFDPEHGDPTDHFRGFIGGILRVDGILGSVIDEASSLHYGIAITDVTEIEQPKPLVQSLLAPLNTFGEVHTSVVFAKRTFNITFYADKEFKVASKDWTSWSILTFGFFLAALLQSLMLNITGTTENVRREVLKKTKELTEATQIAENANKAKSEFVANMNHELRTPLNAIIGMVNQCLKTQMTTKQTDYLQKVSMASKTLLSLINQTLDYSKIEAGKMDLENERFDLCDLLHKTYSIFSSVAEQKNIDFQLQLPDSLPSHIIGDALRLEQVLINLCGNACKFTTQGHVKLTVQEAQSTPTSISLDFIVDDTGIGISPEKMNRLFEPFHQADSSTSRKFGGTGLGLVISKQLTELMGGSISSSSTQGYSSCFRIHIPFTKDSTSQTLSREAIENEIGLHNKSILKQPEPEIDNTQDVTPEIDTIEQKLKNTSILVVEDVPMNQQLVKEILEDYGASITLADNGLQALKQLQNNTTFDLVLMDIQMPEMDGYEATRQMRNDPSLRTIPVIAMTANTLTSDIESCLKAGMNDHIGKPISEEQILATILKHLLKKSSAKE